MTDIVERLRRRAADKFIRDYPIMTEAADEIERLRNLHKTAFDLDMDAKDREIERLRKQLAEYKISPQYAAELARQVDELEAENEGLLGRLSDQNSARTQETK